jgi:hypothetical protein
MDQTYLVALSFLVSLGSVLVFALVGKSRAEQRFEDEDTPKSSRAADRKHRRRK